MNKAQLQISLTFAPTPSRRLRRKQRAVRASWWFERMHRAVDAAVECRRVSPRSLEQSALPIVPDRDAA